MVPFEGAFVTSYGLYSASRGNKAIDSVRLCVRLFPLYLSNRLTFELEFLYVCGPYNPKTRLGFVEVIGESQCLGSGA